MTRPYPKELRLRAARLLETGESRQAVAERLAVSILCVIKWLQRFSKTGSVAPAQLHGPTPRRLQGKPENRLFSLAA